MIIIGNKRIIRLGVSVIYDANSAANKVLDKKELFTVVNRSNSCSDSIHETRV